MKKKFVNILFLIFVFILIFVFLPSAASCQILNDLISDDIFKSTTSSAASLMPDDLKEAESTTTGVGEKLEVNPGETTTSSKIEDITVNIESLIPDYIGAVIINNISPTFGKIIKFPTNQSLYSKN